MLIDDYSSYDRKILTFTGEEGTDLVGSFTLRELLEMNASMDDGSYIFDRDFCSTDYGTIVEENTLGLVYEYISKWITEWISDRTVCEDECNEIAVQLMRILTILGG